MGLMMRKCSVISDECAGEDACLLITTVMLWYSVFVLLYVGLKCALQISTYKH